MKEIEAITKGSPYAFKLSSLFSTGSNNKPKNQGDGEPASRGGSGSHIFASYKSVDAWIPFKKAMDLVLANSDVWTELFHIIPAIRDDPLCQTGQSVEIRTLFTLPGKKNTQSENIEPEVTPESKVLVPASIEASKANRKRLLIEKKTRDKSARLDLVAAEKITQHTASIVNTQKKLNRENDLLAKHTDRGKGMVARRDKMQKELDQMVDTELVLDPSQSIASDPESSSMVPVSKAIHTQSQPSSSFLPLVPSQPLDFDDDDTDLYDPHLSAMVRSSLGHRNGGEGFALVMKAMFEYVGTNEQVTSYLNDPGFLKSLPRTAPRGWRGLMNAYRKEDDTVKKRDRAQYSDSGKSGAEETPAEKRRRVEEAWKELRKSASQ